IGPRIPITVGLSLVSVAMFLLTRIHPSTTYGDLFPSFILMGLGMALVMSPMSTAAMNAVVEAKAGIASGILSMNRMVGGTLGIAVIGAVFQAEAPAGVRDPAAFVHAFSSAMWVATGVAMAGAIIAATLIRGKAEARPDVAAAEAPVSPGGELAAQQSA